MNRSVVQKRFLVGLVAGAALMMGVAVQANSAGLTPGQWKSDYLVLVNGKNSTRALAQFANQLNASVPEQLRSTDATSLNNLDNLRGAKACISPQVAATLTSPASVFSLFTAMNPHCKLVAGQATSNSIAFSGRCSDPVSYTGNVTGQIHVPNSSSWSATIEGVGRFPDALLTAMKLPPKALVPMKTVASAAVISKTCP